MLLHWLSSGGALHDHHGGRPLNLTPQTSTLRYASPSLANRHLPGYFHISELWKIGGWIMLMSRFQFTIIHQKGKGNAVAERLSRMYDQNGFEPI
ncbi:hypothetical protein PR048_011527 [Dryococelus australis]|uniref:Uncharacterized protein n=1 Tax=Dryococelus australis TaxID=614101 RepID=A0ABQ9HLT3_9NEOP|nr:hypothetical protein PR048_011527 [Dryococelus australis]